MVLDILKCISDFAASQDLCISFSLIHQPPTWRTRVSLFVWVISFNMSGMGGLTSCYITASIGLWIIWSHKPQNYVKVEIPSVGSHKIQILFVFKSSVIMNLNALYMLCIHMYCDLNNIFSTRLLCKIQEKLSPVHNMESRETLNRKCLYTVLYSFTVQCGACGHIMSVKFDVHSTFI